MKKVIISIGAILSIVLTSCGPTLCECANYKTNDEEACKRIYKSRLGTENPSFIRLESVRKNCK
jgi:hypothetical protein